MRKHADGTLTVSEEAQLRELLRERLRDTYETCPACGGAFSAVLRLDSPLHCPVCEVQLVGWSADLVGHHVDEIDPTLPKPQLFGEFVVGYSFPGVVPCLQCGMLYPKRYSCCPRLFGLAAGYFGGGIAERTAAAAFINLHAETLLNVLRSSFQSLLDRKHRQLLRQIAPFVERRDEIDRVLKQMPAMTV